MLQTVMVLPLYLRPFDSDAPGIALDLRPFNPVLELADMDACMPCDFALGAQLGVDTDDNESLPPDDDLDSEEALPDDDPVQRPARPCCKRNCCNQLVPKWALSFRTMNKNDQDKWLFLEMAKGDFKKMHGRICGDAVRHFLHIGRDRYLKIQQAVRSGALEPPADLRHQKSTLVRSRPRTDDVDTFFLWIYMYWAQPMPTTDIHGFMKKRGEEMQRKLNEIRSLLEKTHPATELEKLGPRHLVRMVLDDLVAMHTHWTLRESVSSETMRKGLKRWSCVLVPRQRECTHKPCSYCAELELRRKAAACREELEVVARETAQHRDNVFADRRVYAYYSALSATATAGKHLVAPEDSVLMITIDGMDQSKFLCPRNVQASKLWDSLWRPQLGFIGALVHGVAECFYILDPCLQKSGSTIVEVLFQTLEKVRDILAMKGVAMPRHLHIHVDNTTRENKNNTMMKSLIYLLEKQFASVCLEFFMVGHTHCDLDQRFSTAGPVLAEAEELERPADFGKILETKYKPLKGHVLDVSVMEAVRDWKSWLHDISETFAGHAGKGSPHSFKMVHYGDLCPEWQALHFQERDGLGEPQADDVVQIVKAYVRDSHPLQEPLVIRRAHRSLPCEKDIECLPMKEHSERPIKEYRSTAEVLDKDPWNLHAAAKWLRYMCSRWENNTPGFLKPLTYVFQGRVEHTSPMALQEYCQPMVIQAQCHPIHLVPTKMKAAGAKAKAQAAGAKAKAKGKAVATAKAAAAPIPVGAVATAAASSGEESLPSAPGSPLTVEAPATPTAAEAASIPTPAIPAPAAAGGGAAAGEGAAAAAPPPPAAGRRRKRPPPPVPLGCAKCRRLRGGCGVCRRRAGVDYSPTRSWHSI